MPALSERCTEQTASALAGDLRTTLGFAGEDGHRGEDLCPNPQLSKGAVFLFWSVKPK